MNVYMIGTATEPELFVAVLHGTGHMPRYPVSSWFSCFSSSEDLPENEMNKLYYAVHSILSQSKHTSKVSSAPFPQLKPSKT